MVNSSRGSAGEDCADSKTDDSIALAGGWQSWLKHLRDVAKGIIVVLATEFLMRWFG